MGKKIFSILLAILLCVVVIMPTVSFASEGTLVSEATTSEEIIIEDDMPPLGVLNETQKMTWWWLVIVVAIGTAGAELIRRHQFNKSEDEMPKF